MSKSKSDKKDEKEQTSKNKEVARSNNQFSGLVTVDLEGDNVPSLQDAETIPVELMSEYWTPSEKGESRKCFFLGIEIQDVADSNTGDVRELKCVKFAHETDDGLATFSNGSKLLVAAFDENEVPKNSAWKITYLGKKDNKTNSYKSDNWRVQPLRIEV